jgi:hypothetical protein
MPLSPDLDASFADAAHVVECTIEQNRYVPVPMETRGIVAWWHEGRDELEVTCSTQSVHETRNFFARYLGVPEGNVRVTDDRYRAHMGLPPFDSDFMRPVDPEPWCRVVGLSDDDTLWPERWSAEAVHRARHFDYLPHRFQQLFMQECLDDATARCQSAWVEMCKRKGRDAGHHLMAQQWEPPPGAARLVFTGVDLAVDVGEEHDDTAMVTFAVLPDGHRLLLDVDRGKFNGPTILEKVIDKQKQFDSVLVVENVGSQAYLLQFHRQRDVSIPLRGYTTGRTKAHPERGVEGFFIELRNGAWLIPNDSAGRCHPNVQKLLDACLNYVPTRHVDDSLMALFFAREIARQWGVLGPEGAGGDQGGPPL